jgi:hypothetical protein
MRRRHELAIGLIVLLALAGVVGEAQPMRSSETGVEDRLMSLANRLRLSLSIASFAVYAPTIGDLHLHAQQLVNLLEGTQGRHYVRPIEPDDDPRGLVSDVTELARTFVDQPLDPTIRIRIGAATKNVDIYLGLALDAALSSLQQRRLDQASEEMLRVYAYLAAAYERPCEIPRVPGLWTVLRVFGLVEDPPSDG